MIKNQTVTRELVKDVSEDIVKVIVDYYGTQKKRRSEISTGKFELLKKRNNPVDSFMPLYSVNLICEGKKIKR